MEIYFDMDGTLVNLYGVKNWLNSLVGYSAKPFVIAKPLVNMSRLARVLHKLQAKGHKIGIISWTPPTEFEFYENQVTFEKIKWLKAHLPSVDFDEIHILPYKSEKNKYANAEAILFDDEIANREKWNTIGKAYDEKQIFEILEELLND